MKTLFNKYLQIRDTGPSDGGDNGGKQSKPESHYHDAVQDLSVYITQARPCTRASTCSIHRIIHKWSVTRRV